MKPFVCNLVYCRTKIKIIDSVAVPSATKAIRSAYIPTMWLFHLPQGNNISPSHKVAIPSATDGNNISHHIFGNNISHHTLGNSISQQQVVITSTTIQQKSNSGNNISHNGNNISHSISKIVISDIAKHSRNSLTSI